MSGGKMMPLCVSARTDDLLVQTTYPLTRASRRCLEAIPGVLHVTAGDEGYYLELEPGVRPYDLASTVHNTMEERRTREQLYPLELIVLSGDRAIIDAILASHGGFPPSPQQHVGSIITEHRPEIALRRLRISLQSAGFTVQGRVTASSLSLTVAYAA